MVRLPRSSALAVILCAAAAPSAVFAAPSPHGVWMNDTGRGAVEIKPCGAQLCGHVVWIKSANDAKGCGRQIIGEASEVRPGLWDGGWIYSPEDKRRYNVELKALDDGTLRVMGYMGTKLFSRTMIWKRAPDTLERCGVQEAAKPVPAAAIAAAGSAPAPAQETPKANTAATAPSPKSAIIDPPARTALATPPPAQMPKPEQPHPQQGKASDTHAAAPPAQKGTDKGTETAASGDADEAESAGSGSDAPTLDLKKLKIDKFLKRTASGDCKLDLPFFKVRFSCGEDRN